MAGIKNIRDLYKKVGEKGLREVLEGEIRVTEKFDAYRFAFEKNPHNYKIYFYGKNGKTPLNKIDRTINDLYEKAISYIENLPPDIKRAIPVRHRFGFSWFPTKSPLNTEYERNPKKGLVLTDITIRNRDRDVTHEVKESQVFERWAGLFGVEASLPLFTGKLDESTVNALLESAKDSDDYQFAPLNETQLHVTPLLQSGIEAMVFETPNQLFKVEGVKESHTEKRPVRSHLFDILLLDISEHISSYNIAGMKPISMHPDEAYIEVVSEIFNDFVEKKGNDFLDSGLDKPKFLEKSGSFNRGWVKNPKTLSLIESNKRYEYLLSVFLSNLKKPKYVSGLLNESVVNKFNSKIEEIDRVISDDYSFLEFQSILKEDENFEEDQTETTTANSVVLLQSFFGTNRNVNTSKGNVNVIVCDATRLSNNVLKEAERLMKLNGERSFLLHDTFIAKTSYSLEESIIRKILSKFIEDHNDLFVGYRFLEKPLISEMYSVLGKEFIPISISLPNTYDTNMVKLEIDHEKTLSLEKKSPVRIEYYKHINNDMLKDIESESVNSFKKNTPACMHAFWSDVKGAFDKHTYI